MSADDDVYREDRMSVKSVAVVGAGLAGLTAAYRLQQAGCAVTVFEATHQVGGRTQTVLRDGYVIDTGASAIAESYTEYKALLAELGLSACLKPASVIVGVARDGRIHELNTAALYRSALTTRLLSFRSKLRLAAAFVDVGRARRQGQLEYTDLQRAAPLDFETAQQYAMRRLNPEIADYFCDPLVRAMQLADADKISKVELFSGIANIFRVKLYGLEGGVNRMAQALDTHVHAKTDCPVQIVRCLGDQVEVQWQEQGESRSGRFDACIMACPSPAAAKICTEDAPLQALNQSFGYGQSITVAFGVRVRPRTKAYLLEIPKRESRDIALLMLEHNKIADAAPPNHGLVIALWEDAAATSMMAASEAEIIARTQPLLLRLMPELTDQIDMVHVTRWPTALPFSRVGTFAAVGRFKATARGASRTQFAGDYTSATGQNNALESGNRAARSILAIGTSQ